MYHTVSYIGDEDGNNYARQPSHFCASCHIVHFNRDNENDFEESTVKTGFVRIAPTTDNPNVGDLALQSAYDDWGRRERYSVYELSWFIRKIYATKRVWTTG